MSMQQGMLPGLEATQITYSERFLQDHAGHLIADPRVAIIEAIANAYDAGATKVEVNWPEKTGDVFAVSDNGMGMTKDEFEQRWLTLNYDRTKSQGQDVRFPPNVKGLRRKALGQSGKGRHALFCFTDKYSVETWQDGKGFVALIEMTHGGTVPFSRTYMGEIEREGHGTRIHGTLERHRLDSQTLSQLIGSKFLVDPSFSILVNDASVALVDLQNVETERLVVETLGEITVHFIDAGEHSRTARLRGITWWANGRMVGEPSWDRLDDDGAYLDGRTDHAKRFSFVIEADCLKYAVKDNWSGFHCDQNVNVVRKTVHTWVLQKLRDREAGSRRARKLAALSNSRELLGELPFPSRTMVGEFVDEVQEKCPTMTDRDLTRTVGILAKLEQSRWGYDLLAQLDSCTSTDLDTWNEIMKQWTASNAAIILGELDRRLRLIEKMEGLVNTTNVDELHDLQPLFERGLWIFGPEYEAVDFRSNRGLTEVIGNFLGPSKATVRNPRKRPDFVVLPDASIGAYSSDAYDANGEVSGLRKVLVIELKKGGFNVTQDEVDQARDYCMELRKAGKVQKATLIHSHILGETLENGLEEQSIGNPATTVLLPMDYDTVLRKAHARTFNLRKMLQNAEILPMPDAEVEAAVKTDATLFSTG